MKGSVRKRYNNAWSYRIDLGFVDGKRKQVERGGFKTEREAVKAMQDALYHLNNTGDYVENKKISFHTVYEEFIEREGKACAGAQSDGEVMTKWAIRRAGWWCSRNGVFQS